MRKGCKRLIQTLNKLSNRDACIVFLKSNSLLRVYEFYVKRLCKKHFSGIKFLDCIYSEALVGEKGIDIAIKSLYKDLDKGFYVLAIRGRCGTPRLYEVSNTGALRRHL